MKNLFSKVWNYFNRKNIEIEKLQEANKALDQENFRLTNSYNVEWDISTYREKRIVKLEKEKKDLQYVINESKRKVMETKSLMDEKIKDLVLQIQVPTESISLLHLFRTELRQGYDSSWVAILNTPNGLEVLYLTCRDGESTGGLTKEIGKCQTIDRIRALDQREHIWYD
ncbi:hypothetical protein CSV80_11135 [Sporosarcina sp. P12(2017)]|uniref:hypothetical protein n=1 Tax=unclassified Sporosarcina TaxID=2647733 RepID=UPI000C17282D|nr:MULTISPECIES: hypothetical protein [unclassified Sporosarcina]PIC57014.1 hypothetical protein CSV81_11535 [Sporosarcina sp. P10]PIC60397.1 hypothetical protein CSV80_11135 [Sporosarcina sp. P12(2017)]